ncbi:MAG: RNA-binding S4 domain-containing protein [Clostridia bacterium]|nr:RNA-binding S4 domain-containing protein [Clostridia bacterium]MBQ6718333.1 RNA-binding S4 domain-containing protein [Clostridia bacterium]
MKEIFIRDEFIRLDSALKFSGAIGTGGQAKIVIQEGEVYVNGEVCVMRGKKLRDGDTVKFKNFEFVIKNEG